MNELLVRWGANSSWEAYFDESDRLVVESLVRRANDENGEGRDLEIDDDEFLFTLLLLARASRLEHVALSLTSDDLEAHLRDLGAPVSIASAVQHALRMREHPLNVLVQWSELDQPVSMTGPSVVVATRNDVPTYLYFRRLAHAEWRLTRALVDAHDRPMDDPLNLFTATAHGLSDPSAREVARRLAQHRISVVTGGPGTGKTTTISHVLHELSKQATAQGAPLFVALAAPTAKAAVRLREALDQALGLDEHSTVHIDERSGSLHRLLALRADRDVGTEPLEHNLIVVDEVSMSELTMLDQLVARASEKTRIVLVGDSHQLASVNVGAALRDIVEAANSGALSDLVTSLSHNWRSGSAIVELANAINAGDAKLVAEVARTHQESVHIASSREAAESSALAHARRLRDVAASADADAALRAVGSFVVLGAMRRGEGSVQWWNSRIEPQIRTEDDAGERFAVGTPVLVTKNEFGSEPGKLANGDLGVQLGGVDKCVVFSVHDLSRRRVSEQLGEATAAWAITIHKSQGSEYDEVIVSLPEYDVSILTRELLYTAVTRARHRVNVLASFETIERVLARRIERVSGLALRAHALRDAHSTH